MKDQYFVLYKRDHGAESMGRAKGRFVYDKINEFESYESAKRFAFGHLHDTPIVAKNICYENDLHKDASYIVAAHFPKKYSTSFYDGSHEYVPTHEVIKTKITNLDAIVQRIATEKPDRMYLGIEQRIIPQAMQIVQEVNRQ